jgi:hypothetical protein
MRLKVVIGFRWKVLDLKGFKEPVLVFDIFGHVTTKVIFIGFASFLK